MSYIWWNRLILYMFVVGWNYLIIELVVWFIKFYNFICICGFFLIKSFLSFRIRCSIEVYNFIGNSIDIGMFNKYSVMYC